jgi:fatty acid/phospholipid biosynthesis enzyme
MRRRIENPRILLLDCPLEYKKGESQVRRAWRVFPAPYGVVVGVHRWMLNSLG